MKINRNLIYILLILLAFNFSDLLAQSSVQNKYRLAQTFEKAGDYEKAGEIYAELLELQPNNFMFLRSLNNIYLQLKKYEYSIDLLKSKIEENSKDIDLYGMLGATYYIKGEQENAFEIWDEAVDNFPGQNSRFRTIANYAIENRALDKGIEILKKGKENSSDPVQFSYDLANLYSATMKFEKAAEEYAFALSRQPKQITMIRSRIRSYIFSQGAYEPTVTVFENYYDETKNLVFLDVLSYLYRQKGDFEKAFEAVEELDKKSENNGSKIFSFAQDAYREGNYETAAKAYSEIINNHKNSALLIPGKLGYARSLESKYNQLQQENSADWKTYSEPDTAFSNEYFKILNIYKELSGIKISPDLSKEALMRSGIILKDHLLKFNSAESVFTKIIESSPISPYAQNSLLELSKIYIQQDDLQKAEINLQKILSISRNPVELKNEASFLLGKIYFWQKDFQKSLEYLNDAANYLDDDYSNNAIELSMIINSFKNDSLNLSEYAKADLLAEQNKFFEAKEKFKKIANNENLFLLNDLAKIKYAETALALDELPEAAAVLEEIIESEKENFYSDKSLYLLAEIYNFGFRDEEEALKYYEKLLEEFPNSLYFEKSREKINRIATNKRNSI